MQDLFSQSAALAAVKECAPVLGASAIDAPAGTGGFLWGIGFDLTEEGSGYVLCCSEETAKRENLTHPYLFSTHYSNDPNDEQEWADLPIAMGVKMVWMGCLSHNNPERFAELKAKAKASGYRCSDHAPSTPK